MNKSTQHFFKLVTGNAKKLAHTNFVETKKAHNRNKTNWLRWLFATHPRYATSLALILLSTVCFAQKKKSKQKATIVVGKILSAEDRAAVNQFFFEGLRQKVTQNLVSAVDYFNRVIAIDPANDAAMYELATLYTAQNNTNDAADLMQKAVTVNPDNKWYWLLLEGIYVKMENIAQLNFVYDELIRLNPDTQEYYLAKGNNLVIQNKLNEASLLYEEIQKRFGPSNELTQIREQIYLQNGEPEKAIAQLEKQIQEKPKNGNNYAYLAAIYTRLGNRDKAISLLEKGKKIDPQNTIVRLNLANNYGALNRLNDAFIELKIAFADRELTIDTKINIILSFFPVLNDIKSEAFAEELIAITLRTHPDDSKAYAIYGDLLFQKQKYTQALQAYKSGIELNPQMYPLWEQIIRIEITQNNFQQAIADGETALAVFPNQATLYFLSAMAYAHMGQPEKTISYLQTAIALNPTDKQVLTQIYSTLGDAYNTLKRYQDSDQAYEKALEIDPANSYVLNNYAYFLSERDIQLEKAAKMSKYSLELDPNNASSEDTYAWILFKQKNYKEARIWIEKALHNDKSNSPTLIEHYGDILYHLNEKTQALEQWKRAKAAGGDSEQLKIKIKDQKYVK